MRASRQLLLTLALLAPLASGCLGDEPAEPATGTAVATSAEDAGAVSGPAPSAPKEAYQVAAEDGAAPAVAYPARLTTNPARAPVTLDFSDAFSPQDCRPLNFGDLEDAALQEVSRHRRLHLLADQLQVGDVFQYEIHMSYTNAADNWAEIHPRYGLGNTILEHEESTAEANGEVVIHWLGQSYRASDDDPAFLVVECEIGQFTQPIPYTLTITFTFGDSAVPAETPLLVPVPEGATRMFVRGVAVDPEEGVLSHFRLFGPDDAMLCECALGSNMEVATVPVTPGEHVILVDHTSNGFVSLAFDAPPTAELRALEAEWVETQVLAATGEAVDTIVTIDLPRVPLFMEAFVRARDSEGGLGQQTSLVLTNERGEPLRIGWGGHLTFDDGQGGTAWLGIPNTGGGASWFHVIDHHAFAPGAHQAQVKADFLRGEIYLLTRQYVR